MTNCYFAVSKLTGRGMQNSISRIKKCTNSRDILFTKSCRSFVIIQNKFLISVLLPNFSSGFSCVDSSRVGQKQEMFSKNYFTYVDKIEYIILQIFYFAIFYIIDSISQFWQQKTIEKYIWNSRTQQEPETYLYEYCTCTPNKNIARHRATFQIRCALHLARTPIPRVVTYFN